MQQVKTLQKSYSSQVMLWLFISLSVTSISAVFFELNHYILDWATTINSKGRTVFNMYGIAIAVLPLAIMWFMGSKYKSLSFRFLVLLLCIFSIINGASMSFVFATYNIGSIGICFVSASAIFGIMAFLGYTTDKDLTSIGVIISTLLAAIIISILINIYLHSELLNYILNVFALILFIGIVAYDFQQIKERALTQSDDHKKDALINSISIYLDFLNIFSILLRLFGIRSKA